jgi:hypothetical protein
MKLKNLFKTKKKQEPSALSQILSGNEILPQDHPNVIYMAVGIVSEYGEILEETSSLSNVPEEALPYPKKDIQKAIELLLNFLKNRKDSWGNLEENYSDISRSIINNSFYSALRAGYIELAKFIPKNDANLCLKATVFLNEPENKDKTNEEMALAIKENPWLSNALRVSDEIEQSKIQRLKHLQGNYGKEDFIFSS